ncbi:hypothetical protein [Polyangium sp. y55x31]|uniref:hypothetical protein n=1 Tax=Polyangium sp. y55x31 TaxID=3042688 RepID=UPI002482120F|nr:hypothetical protein [Polyangium sp. y55x31]MDI1481197.1 hypothetical protein [Polyangium sp. y55x31]
MRASFLILAALTFPACSRGEPTEVTLDVGKATRVNGCNVFVHDAKPGERPASFMTPACDVPESLVNEKNWWGEGLPRPATTMIMGDCMRLGDRFYCMVGLEADKSVTLKATYEITHPRRVDHLRPIR